MKLEVALIKNEINEKIVLTNKFQEKLEKAQEDVIIHLSEIIEIHSQETGHHIQHVSEYTRVLGKAYGLSPTQVNYLATASLAHDVGKISIPNSVLLKKEPLTNDEWSLLRSHCEIGYDFFKNFSLELFDTAAIVAHEHHERWDGSGYPRKLKGKDINIYGRIVAVADVFDALGSERCYKKAWKNEDIFTFLKNKSGKYFDPEMIELFFENIDEILELQSQFNNLKAEADIKIPNSSEK
jgi:response regulator RpfG family c-di-GMP phosphodiesterase